MPHHHPVTVTIIIHHPHRQRRQHHHHHHRRLCLARQYVWIANAKNSHHRRSSHPLSYRPCIALNKSLICHQNHQSECERDQLCHPKYQIHRLPNLKYQMLKIATTGEAEAAMPVGRRSVTATMAKPIIIHFPFYRTQLKLGSDLWVRMSVQHLLET